MGLSPTLGPEATGSKGSDPARVLSEQAKWGRSTTLHSAVIPAQAERVAGRVEKNADVLLRLM
jgi:hypothetical protein